MTSCFNISVRNLLVAVAVLQTGCVRDPQSQQKVAYLFKAPKLTTSAGGGQPLDNLSYWDGKSVRGAPSIEIHLRQQCAYFYKGSQLVGVSQISTGREGHDTRPGTYRIIQRDRDHRSSSYGDFVDADDLDHIIQHNISVKDPKPVGSIFLGAPMPNFLRLTDDGIGMHAGYLPGLPASHGCIRMPARLAEDFFDNAPLGTPVVIQP